MHQHSCLYTQGLFSFMCITLYFPLSLVRLGTYKERGREEGPFFGRINSTIVTYLSFELILNKGRKPYKIYWHDYHHSANKRDTLQRYKHNK